MNPRIIKTDNEYQDAINKAAVLAMRDPANGTHEAEKLELLALLIEDYERKHFNFDVPDPVSAIEFRMEEQGLRQRDLIPILGSRSRVSEVLSRKRPLTLQMIRSLTESLGIPSDVLIRPMQQPQVDEPIDNLDWMKFPFREMQRRGWIPNTQKSSKQEVMREVKNFLDQASSASSLVPLYRKTVKGLGASELEERASYSATAWTARVIQRSKTCFGKAPKFDLRNLDSEFIRSLVKLSLREDGPIEAISNLTKIGICVVVEPHLPGTLIDGAAILNCDRKPIIGLTLRFDRIDYFWFTLAHELAHIWKHLNDPNESFIDRIDASDFSDRIEKEANRIARDSIIPREIWTKSAARVSPSPSTISELARSLEIHPALVAGRIRYETGEYNKFSRLLGQGKVRCLFNM
jgi:HTH-type transcriptional regulator/antitoxin HigA